MNESGNKNMKDVQIGNDPENLAIFDKCTLEIGKCGFCTQDGFCLSKDRCGYSLFEKYVSKLKPNEKSTIEIILETIRKRGKGLTMEELFAIIPEEELEEYICTNKENKRFRSFFVVDAKGNILNLKNGNEIRRNFRK
jgi:predicted CopG family antitoxin